jgi:hemerythrin-like domain-containing protein
MDPIQVLMDEHRQIERVMSSLLTFVNEVKAKRLTGGHEDLERFAEFFRDFADRTHHGKEEDILFRILVEGGFPRDGGPIAVMLAEHQEGRARVRILKEIAENPAPWGSAEREKIENAAAVFVTVLRQHIQKEDNILYPMARAHLSAELMAEIARQFRAFEEKEQERGEVDRLWNLGRELEKKFKAPVVEKKGTSWS